MNEGERIFRLRLFVLLLSAAFLHADQFATELPPGVVAEWNLGKAERAETGSRDRICINGLWRWQPANGSAALPTANWGFFKVPGAWPGLTDYLQQDSQTLYAHESWREVKPGEVTAAWYQREIQMPVDWGDRRIVLSAAYLNSFAVAFLDGKRAGEIRFPGGELDLTEFCRPGEKQLLTLLVTAMPLKGVMLSYTDSASARQVKGSVARRGLCGDVFLEALTKAPGIGEVRVQTPVRRHEIEITAALRNLKPQVFYTIDTSILGANEKLEIDREHAQPRFTVESLENGKFTFARPFPTNYFWDIHTPQKQLNLVLTLREIDGPELDHTQPVRFGFRDLWIDGRDFYLNGTRIFLSAVPLDNAQVGVAWSTYAAARESLERLKSFGINFVYTHNYGCEPGTHLSFEEILRAADDAGMLVALSQPHFSQYEWKSPEADRTNGYATHAEFYTQVAGNHPSVVFYAMSHNATGYSEDMNPDMIDGIHAPRDQWAARNADLALRAEAIVHRLDPSRIVYHHASGNLGSMHPINFYPNFVPIQELSDWFGHWATNGVKPAFMCEYGAPFTWDWTMYRGWYQGQREFGSAKVPWEFCVAEWNAQFLGDRAYRISDPEKANLRWEAKQFRAGNSWHRWDYPFPVGSDKFDEQYPVFARYLDDNWRAFRGWGVSAISPWEYEHFWKLRRGVKRERQDFATDWEKLQRPGFAPDYIAQPYDRMDLGFERSDWIPTAAGEGLLRNNQPLLAFIGGKGEAFTSKDHNFYPGERLQKQLIIINNSRETVQGSASWWLNASPRVSGRSELEIRTGQQERWPIELKLAHDLLPGAYKLGARIEFGNGEAQEDEFEINILAPRNLGGTEARIALFDPKGETERLLKSRRVAFERIYPNADLSKFDLLIVGQGALTVDGAAPEISQVRDGLRVIVFEQGSSVLEKRFGFRVEEYGLRQVFSRLPDHPILSEISPENLRDWRGEATLLPPRLEYEMRPRYGPTVRWCDIPVTRAWRCGNRGNVASVLIEKPPGGDFLPILDGGYALQFSPLLEYREGRGMVLFCQLDLTGRTEADPAAERLANNILQYAFEWKPVARREVVYLGPPEGKDFLQSIGVRFRDFQSATHMADDLLVIGGSAKDGLSARTSEIKQRLEAGGRLLAIGVSPAELNELLPFKLMAGKREHISTFFDPPGLTSPARGISPADLHNRDPREFELITEGAELFGDGVLAASSDGRTVFMQMAPWDFKGPEDNLRRTYRRVSFAVARLLGNFGVESTTPILARFRNPPDLTKEKRWLEGLYVDVPQEWDDPYRFFRW